MYLNDDQGVQKPKMTPRMIYDRVTMGIFIGFLVIIILSELLTWAFKVDILFKMQDVLLFTTEIFGNSFALGVIATTLFVRWLSIPVYASSSNMTSKMQEMQPEINKINEKYIGKNDEASKQKKQQEIMMLYRKNNVNMLGCLIPFLQMPLFITFYRGLRNVAMNHDQYIESHDISYNFFGSNLYDSLQGNYDDVVLWIIVILAAASMFAFTYVTQLKPKHLQKVRHKTIEQAQQEKTMKMVMYFMNIMLVWIAFTNPAALPLYWITGNIFSGTQKFVSLKIQEKKHREKELYEVID